jgi:hypothetical protein
MSLAYNKDLKNLAFVCLSAQKKISLDKSRNHNLFTDHWLLKDDIGGPKKDHFNHNRL